MATITLRSTKGSPLTNNEVDANFTNLNTDKAELSGATFTGNLNLGDNVKATFNSNLNIFSTGTSSYIEEVGAGDLYLKASNLYITDRENNQFISMIDNGAGGTVALKHLGSTKIATTSTGIDVTGSVVADGLKVGATDRIYLDGGSNTYIQESASDDLRFFVGGQQAVRVRTFGTDILGTVTADGLTVNSGGNSSNLSIRNGSNNSFLNIYSDLNGVALLDVDGSNVGASPRFQIDVGNVQTFRIQEGGDISFYEDTGTTPKFFWDASTERLGLGTFQNATVATLALKTDANGRAIHIEENSGGESFQIGVNADGDLGFYNSGLSTPSLLIEDSGSSVFSGAVSAGGDVNLRLDSTGDGVNGYDINWLNSATQGTDDRLALIRVTNEGGDGSNRGGKLSFLTRQSGNANFNSALVLNKSGNATFSGSLDLAANTSFPTAGFTLHTNGFLYNKMGSNGFIFSAQNGTEAMRISSAQNVNIPNGSLMVGATTAPSAKLDVQGGLAISNSSASYWTLDRDNTDGSLTFTDSYINEAMRINSSGALLLHPNNIGRGLKITTGTGQAVGSDTTYDTIAAGYGQHIFKTDGTERMRLNADGSCRWTPDGTNHDMTLTADGNLLVGTTDTDTQNNNAGSTADNGFAYNIGSGGYLNVARYGGTVAYFNRTSTDGTIADFRKDGTSVGSIASDGGSNLIVKGQGNNAALLFNHTNARIEPYTNSVTDLGRSAAKFKDLYLSDTVYAGVRVCIGTTETPRPLTVNGLAGFRNSTTGFATSDGFDIGVGGSDAYIVQRENANIIIETNGTEAARIDASQNLLVGKTALATSTAGIELRASNLLNVTRTGGQVLQLNRLSSDGEIAKFLKDGTSVGSIGVASGNLTISSSTSGKTGLYFGSGALFPMNSGSLDGADQVSFGSPNYQFKDLYLSGGVYLGGTGSANKLDDYEEGTFTITLSGTTTAGTHSGGSFGGFYTKIGRQVTCQIMIANTTLSGAAGSLKLSGLPFTPHGYANRGYKGAVATYKQNLQDHANNYFGPVIDIGHNTTDFYLLQSRDDNNWAYVQVDNQAGLYIEGTVTYFTND